MDRVDAHLSVEKSILEAADQGQKSPVKDQAKIKISSEKEDETSKEGQGRRDSSAPIKSILKSK